MTESVEAQQIMLAAMAGAMVVVFGAIHAFLLAWAKLRGSRKHLRLSWAAYACFMLAVVVLAWTLHFSGFWFIVIFIMLVGYLLAPHGIWHLSVATHGHDGDTPALPSKAEFKGGLDHD